MDRPTANGNGQSQPPATTAYAVGTLPSCARHAMKYEINEIKFDLHHKIITQQVKNLLRFGRLIFF